jgi:hypothetical protein
LTLDDGSLEHDASCSFAFGSFDSHRSRNETGGCNGRVNMQITITTDGGFTGRGIGTRSADVDDAVVTRALAEVWRDEYRSPGADLVRYTLTAGDRSVSFTEGAEIPDGLRELFELVWRS